MSAEELKANFSDNPNAADFRPQDLQLALVPFVDMLNHQGGCVLAVKPALLYELLFSESHPFVKS